MKTKVLFILLICSIIFAQDDEVGFHKGFGYKMGFNNSCVPITFAITLGNSIVEGYPYYDKASALDSTKAPLYQLATLFQWSQYNAGIANQQLYQIAARITSDVTSRKGNELLIAFPEGGVNDLAAPKYKDTLVFWWQKIADTLQARGIQYWAFGIPAWTQGTNAQHYTWDSANAVIGPYVNSHGGHWIQSTIDNVLGRFRAGTTNSGNRYDDRSNILVDGIHFNDTVGLKLLALCYYRNIKDVYCCDSSATSQITVTTFATSNLPATVSYTTYDHFCAESSYVSYYRNSYTDSVATTTSAKVRSGAQSVSINPYSRLGDTIHVTCTIVGTQTKSTTPFTFIVTDTDSLVVGFDFENGFGRAKNTYTQLIPSIAGWKQDSLLLGSTTGAESDDPADSTSSGFLSFTRTASQRGVLTSGFTCQPNYTIIFKTRGWGATAGVVLGGLGDANWSTYTSTSVSHYNATFTGGGATEYYALWGQQADDSVTAIVYDGTANEVRIYRNGVLRVTRILDLSGTKLITFLIGQYSTNSLYFNGRFYYLYFYNDALSVTRVARYY